MPPPRLPDVHPICGRANRTGSPQTEAAGWALPYGIRDLTVDAGQVSVGISHGTAVSVVRTILRC